MKYMVDPWDNKQVWKYGIKRIEGEVVTLHNLIRMESMVGDTSE